MIINGIFFVITAPLLLVFSIIVELFKPLWFEPLEDASRGRKIALAVFFLLGWWFIIPVFIFFFLGFEGIIGLAGNKEGGPGGILREIFKELSI